MSVIVKGMEMPECCAECYFSFVYDVINAEHIEGYGVCMAPNRKEYPTIEDVSKRSDDCPLEEVQEDDMR